MAALAAAIVLLRASVATGIGSEIQKPLARVVVGGMVTSAILILLVLPAMYLIVHRWAERRATVREPMKLNRRVYRRGSETSGQLPCSKPHRQIRTKQTSHFQTRVVRRESCK